MLSTLPPSKSIALFEESIQRANEYNDSVSKRRMSSINSSAMTLDSPSQNQNCSICLTPVYPAEKISIDHLSLHPACFRCHHCTQLLSFSNSEKVDGRFFCKAHYKLYSSGDEKSKSNPFLANARYSNLLPLTIKAEEALGKSVSGKKAAYQSLVDVKSIRNIDKSQDLEFSTQSPSEKNSKKNSGRLERTRSLFLPLSRSKDFGNKSFKISENPSVSCIVQTRLRLYEKPEETTSLDSFKENNYSKDSKAPMVSDSIPTSQANNISVLSPTINRYDTSLAAASKTNLRSRIKSYQGKWSTSDMSKANSLSDITEEEENTGTISRTFKNVVESLINYGRQNNTEIKIRENLSRRKSIRVGPSKTSSTTHHSSIINAEGLVSNRLSVVDAQLKAIFDQVTELEPSIIIQDDILNKIQAVDLRLMEQDATIEKLQIELAQLRSIST